ncbi:sugar ABC transporter ATP-binding protein [Vallitalea pronyensis]|uniref:Sugar ABC transporter ATP-binding protein n=1 Tax=Vallitalea pronyensis TaxID=1348613 RepID=A0A8J8MNU7_9FIRM|nr:sugar ABC transporter ATP-binding protein [Vallitalea pronyensis]QUI25367.1 sugar ABC transporter ATP-binding protein [Vallitalea pronyensis]
MGKKVLETKSIIKRFPGVTALEDVSFCLYEGEVHALIGENGAGKSTLMNILSGVFTPCTGNIFMFEEEVVFKDSKAAYEKGLSMIHQELALACSVSVAENVFLGRLKKNRLGLVDNKKMERECQKIFDKYNIKHINPSEKVKHLSTSKMQLVEIAKALSRESKIIIMDEPTASLTKSEVENLLDVIRVLKEKGVAIIYISHRLDEVEEIADRITVFRDGQLIKTMVNEGISTKEMAQLMVGRELDDSYNRCHQHHEYQQEIVLKVSGLKNKNIHDVNFELHKGEILGLTGLVGSGRTEVVEAIFGKDSLDEGTITIKNQVVRIRDSRDAIECGIGLVPEGRKTQGLFLNRSVKENISILNLQYNGGMINQKKENSNVAELIKKFNVKTPNHEQKIQYLSGGNQQKAVIARCLLNKPEILILDEPTHGVDIGAKMEIYQIIDELAASGVSIILISSEMQEILMMCDRVLVMHNGTINGTLSKEDVEQEKIVLLATDQVR